MLLKRMLPLTLGCLAALSATAGQEISLGAGAIDTVMLSKFSHYGQTITTQVSTVGSSVSGEFYVGYAYNINKGFDIGAEVFYDLGGPEIESNIATPGYVKNSLKNTLGIRIIPGFNITPSTRVYAGAGYAMFKTSVDITDTKPELTFASTSTTKKGGDIFYTAGLETMMYTSFGLRASYTVLPGGTSIPSLSSTNTYANGLHEKYKAKSSFNEFFLGAFFRFGWK